MYGAKARWVNVSVGPMQALNFVQICDGHYFFVLARMCDNPSLFLFESKFVHASAQTDQSPQNVVIGKNLVLKMQLTDLAFYVVGINIYSIYTLLPTL